MNKKMVSDAVLTMAVGLRPQMSAANVPTIEQTKHHAFGMIFWTWSQY
jgi:hypothetical protein